ncbi:MAG: sulfatase-like hydrolase/transferase [Actinomycetota bacterium]
MSRPNILFVICDQLRADHLGFAGNQVVQTPNIDAIAAGGTIFDRAYVNNPICMPNRSTIMTGRMPSAHGVIFNDRSLEPSQTTFVSQLRDAGWHTGLIGKSHLQHGESRNAVADLGQPAGRHSPFPDAWDTLEHDERYERGEVIAPDDFYGFNEIHLTLGHGAKIGAHHYQWAHERGIAHEVLHRGLDPDADADRVLDGPNWWQLRAAPYPEEIHSTNYIAEQTIDFIERAEADDSPWMAWCSFPDPHHPMSPPEPWFARHDPNDIDLPSTFDDPGDGWPAHIKLIHDLQPARRAWVAPFGPTPEQARAAIAITYGMIEYIDDAVGRIMATLDRLGATDDTIIVFTSDHGDMMGDHGLILKLLMHFQGCLRVPMVVNAPGKAGGRSTSLAASIDLPHTLLDLCGLDEFQGMQGTSLAPLLDDASATVRDAVLVEEDFPNAATGAPFPLKTRTTVTDTHRYTRDSDGFEVLYDLEHDADELTNLAVDDRDPAARVAALDALCEQMLRADDITRMEPVSQ